MWQDERGDWHILNYWMIDVVEIDAVERGPRVGAHLFSRTLDGEWTFKLQIAFNTTVQFIVGDVIEYRHRERPKLFFSDDGEMTPLYLITGVEELDFRFRSYTLITPIGPAAPAYKDSLGV